jgi:hypothetical protein
MKLTTTLLATAVLTFSFQLSITAADKPPNIVVILVDDMKMINSNTHIKRNRS